MLRRGWWLLVAPLLGLAALWLPNAARAASPAPAEPAAAEVAARPQVPGLRWCRPTPTRQTFLAQALGISEAELQAAQQEATLAWIEDREQKGVLAPRRAELLRARTLVQPYLNPTELVAKALGLSVEEVQQACDAGQTLRDLLAAQNMRRADFAKALRQAADEAVQQAVDDGVVTQEQADALRAWARARWQGRGGRRAP